MSEQQVLQAASFLVSALRLPIPPASIDPFDPQIAIASLSLLFPSSLPVWQQVSRSLPPEEQWNPVLEFIQVNLLDNQKLQFEDLGLPQLTQIYFLLVQTAEQWLQQNGPVAAQNQPQPELEQKEKSQEKGKKNKPKQSPPKSHQQQERLKEKGNTDKRAPSSSKQRPKEVPLQKGGRKDENSLQNQLLKDIKKVLSKRVHKVHPKSSVLFRDNKGTEAVARADRQFQYFIKDYARDKKSKKKLDPSRLGGKKGMVDQHFLKVVERKQKNIEQEVTNQQVKYFMALRDRKIAFVNKIHRLTEQLEKERQIDWAHQQRQLMLQERSKVQAQIQATEALFQKNMKLLKQQYQESKRTNQLQNYEQVTLCREMEKAVSQQKLSELDLMKTLWEQENAKLTNIMGDEQKTKQKLIHLYRKNRP